MTKGNRISASILAERLCQYDVISFDVFGTLILRPFSSPRVLFSIMEERLGIYKFAKIRLDSEDEVRLQKLNSDDGHDNVTLHEIYQLIAKKTNLDANLTAKLEYDLEMEFCYANSYFKPRFPKRITRRSWARQRPWPRRFRPGAGAPRRRSDPCPAPQGIR